MTLLIENLSLEVIIGILPFERENPQTIIINAKLKYDYQGQYLSYAEIIEFLSLELKKNQYGLLEEALEDLGEKVKLKFPQIKSFFLSIKKPNILNECVVGVENEF